MGGGFLQANPAKVNKPKSRMENWSDVDIFFPKRSLRECQASIVNFASVVKSLRIAKIFVSLQTRSK